MFAFSVTLLVITLSVPWVADSIGGVNLRNALTAEWPSFAVYLVSFFMVGQVWIGHHFLFSNFRRVDHSLVWLNMIFLATVAVVPFSTALLGRYAGHPHDRVVAGFVYGSIWTVGAFCLSATFWYASGQANLLQEGYNPKMASTLRLYSAVGPLVYLVFTLFALVNFRLSIIGFVFVPIFYVLQGIRPRRSA